MDRPLGIKISAYGIGALGCIYLLLAGVFFLAGFSIYSLAEVVPSKSTGFNDSTNKIILTPSEAQSATGGSIFFGFILMVFSFLVIYSAYSLFQGKRWAKYACLILPLIFIVLFLPSIILGILVFYFLLFDSPSKDFLNSLKTK